MSIKVERTTSIPYLNHPKEAVPSEVTNRINCVSKCVFHRLALWIGRQFKKLINWVIRVIQAIGNAISMLFHRIFGLSDRNQENSSSSTTAFPSSTSSIPSLSQGVPFVADEPLKNIPSSVVVSVPKSPTPRQLICTTPQFTIHLPNGLSYIFDNPYAPGPHFGDFSLFCNNLKHIFANYSTFQLKLNPGTETALQNPLRSSNQAITDQETPNVRPSLWETPRLTFVQNDGLHNEVSNPFAQSEVPTDEEVYQFRMNLKRLFETVFGRDTVHADPDGDSSGKLTQEPSLDDSSSEIMSSIMGSFQEEAVEQFSPSAIVDYSSNETFPLFSSSMDKLENARNLFLNFIEEDFTVWNQGPLSLGCAISYCIELSNPELNIVLNEGQKIGIRTFFDKLKAVAPDKLDISFYLGGKTELQRILSPRLDELLEIEDPDADELLEINLAKAELATSFGYGIVPTDAGANGAVFIKTFEDVPIGVFKAPQELIWLDFVQIAKQYVGQARLLNPEKGAQQYAEVVASDFCEEFNFNGVAPKAIMATFCGKSGSFIAFKSGFQELKDVEKEFNARKDFSEDEINHWQMMVIWNFFMKNLDPHNENIFVKMGIGGVLEIICMIDHGNILPRENPSFFGPKGNLGAWGHYTISKESFTEEKKAFILENLSEEKVTQFINADPERARFFMPEMRKLQMERIRILRECVANGQIRNPEELAEIKTNDDYSRYLGDGAASSLI